jgi:hypothetical protein
MTYPFTSNNRNGRQRAVAGALLGILIGSATGAASVNAMLAAVYYEPIGVIIGVIVACTVARRWWLFMAVIIPLSCEGTFILIDFLHKHRYDGIDLQTYLQRGAIEGFIVLGLIPAAITVFFLYQLRRLHHQKAD